MIGMRKLVSLLVRDPLVVILTAAYGTVGILVSLVDRDGRKQTKVARRWARNLLRVAGATVRVEGIERIDPKANYVFASNHASYMDTPLIVGYVPAEFRFLAKKSLFKLPFIGNHLTLAGHIPVEREDPRAAVKTMSLAAETIRGRNVSLIVFPEGGRSMDGSLKTFKEGAALIAIKAGVPVVPLALQGTHHLLPMHGRIVNPGPVKLMVGEPIPTVGLTLKDREKLTEQVRQAIAGMLGSL